MRIVNHPILQDETENKKIKIEVDGEWISAHEGEPIAAAIMASGKIGLRYTEKRHDARGVFCGIGRCTDCVMIVDGQPNIRTCVTPARDGMKIQSQGTPKGESRTCKK